MTYVSVETVGTLNQFDSICVVKSNTGRTSYYAAVTELSYKHVS
jgi:hypothetical protein